MLSLISISKKYKYNFILFCFCYFLFLKKINFKSKIKKIIFELYRLTPSGNKFINNKKKDAINTLKNNVFKKKWQKNYNNLPKKSLTTQEIKDIINIRKQKLNNKISGTIYNNKTENKELSKIIYENYMYSNPLHTDLFPELNKMESEIIRMIGNLFDLPKSGSGNLTTGGTESTILALKSYKKYKLNQKWFKFSNLEVITTKTGHAAINKACELLDLKLVYVKLDKNLKMDLNDLKNKINSNTCVVVASSPCYPYGIIDPIQEIGIICRIFNVPLHVDACLGGFITQFDKSTKISFNDNITSLSVDPHKYGCAPKGASLILWNNKDIHHCQYFITEDWTGGIYSSTSLPGSRVGNQIATTWGVLLKNGYEYYKNMAKNIINTTTFLKEKINSIDSFYVLGDPNVNVVAFTSNKYPLSQIIDEFNTNHWNLNILQNPMCLHICITPYNIEKVNEIVKILESLSKKEIKTYDNNLVAIYGMAAKIPSKEIVKDIIYNYLDMTTTL